MNAVNDEEIVCEERGGVGNREDVEAEMHPDHFEFVARVAVMSSSSFARKT